MRMPKERPDTLGPIRADELMPVRVMAKRLGMNTKSIAHAKRAGLKTQRFGRFDYVTGRWVLDFFERLANGENGGGRGG